MAERWSGIGGSGIHPPWHNTALFE
jgi:hypothetical protein